MRPARRSGWPAGWLVAACLPVPVQAEWWTLDNTIESRFESNDNLFLAQRDPSHVNTVNLTDTLRASRRSESASTRALLAATALRSIGGGGIDRVDGRAGLTQTLSGPLDLYSLQADYAQDFNDAVQSADVTLGRGRRRTTTLSGSWVHSFTERLRATTQLSYVRTGYGQRLADASSFDDASASVGANYQLNETDSLTARAGRSRFATRVGGRTSTTDDVNLGASRALSEQGSISASIGAYRTTARQEFVVEACPIAASFCNAGLVARQSFVLTRSTASQGLQFDLSYRHQYDERTSLVASAARKQSPSGTGTVVTSDTINISAGRTLSETLSATLAYAQSRARFDTEGGGSTSQRAVTAQLTKQLADDTSLVATYQHTSAQLFGGAGSAKSNSISVSIKREWPRVDASR